MRMSEEPFVQLDPPPGRLLPGDASEGGQHRRDPGRRPPRRTGARTGHTGLRLVRLVHLAHRGIHLRQARPDISPTGCGATKALLHAQGHRIRGRATGVYRDTDAPEQHASPHDAATTAVIPTRGVLAGARTALILSGIAPDVQIVPRILFAHIARMFPDGAPEQDLLRAAVTA
ncbi:hypothetical protein OS125_09820 [Corynebacterium sp. P7003]|uniref:Uncharacterized protein n=1 Tax=Corynebacterium pygosceleis TaxID=2800406 RepID=A0ABT3WWE0_9CORY|nr:hypothetical protein [Corynebacterium pygosceleis]MCX7445535.1 hypothetical protein [Corynebacterium pygosceleis]